MSKILKLKNSEALKIFNSINDCLKSNENKYEFNYALSKNKKKLEKIVTDINEEIELINKEISRIKVKYCGKDKDGKPIIIRHPADPSKSVYQGLEYGLNPEYDVRMEEMETKLKEIMKHENEIEVYLIKKQHIPEKIFGTNFDNIIEFIEE